MTTPFDSEIRAHLAKTLGGAFGTALDARRVRLPSRNACASFRPPQGLDPARALGANFGALYGAPLVQSVQITGGWLLFDFSPAFFSALVEEVNTRLPYPADDGDSHAVNRMLALARHGGEGCPDHPAFRRAVLCAIVAHESDAAYRRAETAAETLLHSVPPRDRSALLSSSGAFGAALARLLIAASSSREPI